MKKVGDFQPQIPRKHYDLELAVLEAIRPFPPAPMSRVEIAYLFDVQPNSIAHVERSALRKLREELTKKVRQEWLA